jgi:hypothetical protein
MELAGAVMFIGVFGFLAVGAWAGARASERKAQARYALLAKVAEQPPESARLVVEFLREDEARKAYEGAIRARQHGLQAGAVIAAVGVGLGVFLYMIQPTVHRPVWPMGSMLVLMGLVIAGFAYFRGTARDARHAPPRD